MDRAEGGLEPLCDVAGVFRSPGLTVADWGLDPGMECCDPRREEPEAGLELGSADSLLCPEDPLRGRADPLREAVPGRLEEGDWFEDWDSGIMGRNWDLLVKKGIIIIVSHLMQYCNIQNNV